MPYTAATSPLSKPSPQQRAREGEEAVAAWWAARGWQILARNYRGVGFEIDLIATQARHLVFIEVKARRRDLSRALTEFITSRKRVALQRGAQHFISTHQPRADHYRFDLCFYNAHGVVTVLPDVLAEG